MSLIPLITQEKRTIGVRPYMRATEITTFTDADLVYDEFPADSTLGWKQVTVEEIDIRNTGGLLPYEFYTFVNKDRYITNLVDDQRYYMTINEDRFGAVISAASDVSAVNVLPPNGREVEEPTLHTEFVSSAASFDVDTLEVGGIQAVEGIAFDQASQDYPYTGNKHPFLIFKHPPEYNSTLGILISVTSGSTATTIVTGLTNPANTTNLYRYEDVNIKLAYDALAVSAQGTFSTTDNKLTIRLQQDDYNVDLLVTEGFHVYPFKLTRVVSAGDNIETVHGLGF